MKENNLNILQSKVSYQGNTWTSLSEELTIKEVLEEIKSSKYENKIAKLRNLLLDDKKEEYNTHKKNLPAVTFCKYNAIVFLEILTSFSITRCEAPRSKNKSICLILIILSSLFAILQAVF